MTRHNAAPHFKDGGSSRAVVITIAGWDDVRHTNQHPRTDASPVITITTHSQTGRLRDTFDGVEMDVPPELIVLLQHTQSADHVVRTKAEDRLSFFEKTEIRTCLLFTCRSLTTRDRIPASAYGHSSRCLQRPLSSAGPVRPNP